jgi:probable HAF family extracellular repeat protein
MTDLGSLGGYSYAFGINNQGQVVGWSYLSGSTGPLHAVLWDNGVMTDLGTLGGNFSQAYGINDQGQIVGSSTTAGGAQHAVVWANGTITDLGTPPGRYIGSATAINDQGQVVVAPDGEGAYLWQAGVWTSLGGSIADYRTSQAFGINDQSQVVGYSYPSSTSVHAFLWQAGEMTDLGTLGGSSISTASAINNQGQVVGVSGTSGAKRAFLWDSVNGMQDLGSLGWTSAATAINDLGQVVGSSLLVPNGPAHAFYWDSTSGMRDIGTLGDSSQATGINNAGQVVGYSSLVSYGPTHAFLWDGTNGLQDLGTLAGDSWSQAYGINDAGQVIGNSGVTQYFTYGDPYNDCNPSGASADFPHPVVWQNGSVTALGIPDGTNVGQALAINNVGQVIGFSFHAEIDPSYLCPDTYVYSASDLHWFLWQNGVTTDLGGLLPPGSGWTIQTITGINDAGQIIGNGVNPQGQQHGFLLTPDGGDSPAHAPDPGHRPPLAPALLDAAPALAPTPGISPDRRSPPVPAEPALEVRTGQPGRTCGCHRRHSQDQQPFLALPLDAPVVVATGAVPLEPLSVSVPPWHRMETPLAQATRSEMMESSQVSTRRHTVLETGKAEDPLADLLPSHVPGPVDIQEEIA